ncbi:MAG: amino acid racemase [Candidatus Firestonebacteria bacterium]
MKKIGILGGLGPESTISYYEFIIHRYYEKYGNYKYPEIIIYSLCFSEFIDQGYEMADKVKQSIESLHKAGADFVVAACNSVHIVFDEIVNELPIPWISIIDVTAEQIKKNHIKKIGLLGTIFTMGKGFYRDGLLKHGIESIVPDVEDQKIINEIIYTELVNKEVNNDSKGKVQKIIEKLNKKGAQGIVLACTELPFLITQKDSLIKVFDTMAIHAQKALDMATGSE